MGSVFQKGERAALVTAVGTVFFAGLKALAGFLTGSVVLLADALHGASDSVTTFLAWLGLRIARREPTKKFPYGFYKAENVSALLISAFIFFAGYEILKMGWNRFLNPSPVSFSLLAVLVPFFDGIVMYVLGSREVRVGERINSQSLVADGKEAKSHVFLSGVVLLGLVFSFLKIPYVEPLAALFISLFIFREGFESGKNALFSLLDVSPGEELEQRIRWVLDGVSGLKAFERLKLRRSGPFVFGEVTGEVAGSTDVKRAREVSKSIEEKIKKEVPLVDSFTVTLKPFRPRKQRVAVPIDEDDGLSSSISQKFGRAPYFLFADLHKKEVEDFYVRKNPYRDKEVRAGLAASEFVASEKIDSLITLEIGPISLHTLRDHLIEVYQGEKGRVEFLLEKLGRRKLENLKKPTIKKK